MADPATPVVSSSRPDARSSANRLTDSRAVEVSGSAEAASASAVRARLDAKTALIQTRIDTIGGEVVGVGKDARDAIFHHPAVSIGGSLVAGLVVGLLVGTPRDKTRFDSAISHLPKSMRGSARVWAQAAEREVRRAGRKGEDVGGALRDFLTLNHPPVASEARVQEKQKKGIITGALLSILTTVLASAAKTAVENIVTGKHRTTATDEA